MTWARPPLKRLGQNFLQDTHVISTILQAAGYQSTDKVIEIGPGRGALTLPLMKQLNHLIAIELDDLLYSHWSRYDVAKLSVIHANALDIDYRQWGESIRLIGNLPYNISTPLLIRLLKQRDVIEDMFVMLQKEVVDRIVANPGCKDYGRLSVMTQAYCEVSWLLDVPPEAFYPAPKVMSAVIRIRPYQGVDHQSVDFDSLETLVQQAFSMRRKMLANNLRSYLSKDELEKQGLNPKARPEEISVGQYVNLARECGRSVCPPRRS